MYCAHCGNEVPADDRVCTRCGAGLLEPHSVRSTPPEALPDAETGSDAIADTAPGGSVPVPGPRTTPQPTRLSDNQVWDRFMRPAAPRPASEAGVQPSTAGPLDESGPSGAEADAGATAQIFRVPGMTSETVPAPRDAMSSATGVPDDLAATTALPALDAETRTLPGVPLTGPDDDLRREPLDRTRVMPTVPAASDTTPGDTRPSDTTVGALPSEWFRSDADSSSGPSPRGGASPAIDRGARGRGDAVRSGTPAPRPRRRRTGLLAVILLVLLALVLAGLFAWRHVSGGDGQKHPSARPSVAGATAAASPPSDASDCGGGIWASSDTSCEFARVVATQARGHSASTFQLQATSPVTGTRYTMSCTAHPGASGAKGMTVCTGGRAAAVWLRTS